MILTLNIHYSRASDLERPDHLTMTPSVPVTAYRDLFGNWCSRLVAPKGRFVLKNTLHRRCAGRGLDEMTDRAAQNLDRLQIRPALRLENAGGAAEAGAGDIVLFRWRAHLPAKHCAVLTGPATMIHAHDGAVVAEVALSAWWRRRMAGAFRFPGLSA